MARRASRLANLAAVHLSAMAAVAFVAAVPASAQQSLELNVTASVDNICNVDLAGGAPSGLDFDQVTPGQEKVASTTLQIWCTFQNNPKVVIGPGKYSNNGTRQLRRMDEGAMLPYSVCINNPAGDICSPWEDQDRFFPVGTGEAESASVPIYGYISVSDSSDITAPGMFEDMLLVEVEL